MYLYSDADKSGTVALDSRNAFHGYLWSYANTASETM